ncbi:UDP-N-acetylmuramoyl-tripeptide--D-alanyl-D-alanine ligase [Bacillus canaveralius]|uniref:UDP-N-acetylmuramoyl-tripeptide--D-alanyl-D-alanine ligase n=1 Tax=Bacillus canaveralius TaxID=1403243 RepID=A0A2N5GRW2_9BACI|nr:UDP-N-acetylmuramoyl-tripeptide--D-alanyl-D-alanine ligase [Bacillus canaveralius]PLR86300.1 UDP-N-acetylmuramoyl-tripeptide--D-alanyl-D-alanine ligase [Bacillus canaveralius]PLR97765.1 UDP-N-acetylmuramoyl-tripeptide--D-alanyl-D-alanine ligase [Bacillus canaveralius]
MIRKTIRQLSKMIKAEIDLQQWGDTEINGVSIDSRKIETGNLFIPFKGEHADGHRFVEEAVNKGAGAAFWQKDVPNPPVDLPVIIVEDTLLALQELAANYRDELSTKIIGITGSNGKTTTKDMMASVLSLEYKVQKTEGNFNNHIGLPLTVLQLKPETEMAVLEMGMSAKGEIELLTKLARPDAVIITNIGEAHLQDLGSREGIAEAKLEIVKGLQDGGLIVYCGDEPLLRERLKDYEAKFTVKTFGKSRENDLYPTDIIQSGQGSQFTVNRFEGKFHLPVLGVHNVLNALAVMLTARFFGVSYEKMDKGFQGLKLTQMRMELVEGAKGERIINDAYNASPTAMRAAIELISDLEGFSRRIVVLGDMLELGPLEIEYHQQTGASLDPEKIDYVFTYGPLGRFIAEGARQSFEAEKIFAFDDKNDLINELKKYTDRNTLILVKASRGMKLEDVVIGLQNPV